LRSLRRVRGADGAERVHADPFAEEERLNETRRDAAGKEKTGRVSNGKPGRKERPVSARSRCRAFYRGAGRGGAGKGRPAVAAFCFYLRYGT
ncbi:MAG: hypothetical protein J6Y48_16535, partial [Clostridia bacterium]|nr:hypothetical protein [Clostridia bacterium]